jgi:hypothetical protein
MFLCDFNNKLILYLLLLSFVQLPSCIDAQISGTQPVQKCQLFINNQTITIDYRMALFSKTLYNIQNQMFQPTFQLYQPKQTDAPQQRAACTVPSAVTNNTNTNTQTRNQGYAVVVKRGVCPFGTLHTHLYINKYLNFNYFCIVIVSCQSRLFLFPQG